MNLRIVIKERLGYPNDTKYTANLVVANVGGMDIVVGKIQFRQQGKRRVALWLTSNLHGETVPVGSYETVADALAGADDYLSEVEFA